MVPNRLLRGMEDKSFQEYWYKIEKMKHSLTLLHGFVQYDQYARRINNKSGLSRSLGKLRTFTTCIPTDTSAPSRYITSYCPII